MSEQQKRVNVEQDPVTEEESKEEVVNDSLGTVDPADSTGLDAENAPPGTDGTDEEAGDEPVEHTGI